MREHLPGGGDRRRASLFYLFFRPKAPVKCVLSVTGNRPRSVPPGRASFQSLEDPKIVPTAWDPRSAKDQRVTWVTWIGGGWSFLISQVAKLPERGLWPQRLLLGLTQLAKHVGLRPCRSGAPSEGQK